MDKIYIIGDVHGCYKTLMALVEKLPKNAKLCFVGDLIDRGSDSHKVIDFIIKENHLAVMGNHEYRLLNFKDEFLNDANIDERWFSLNGGKETFKSYKKSSLKTKEKHINFLDTLPLYLEFKELKTADDRHLVVSHSAVGGMWKYKNCNKNFTEFRKHLLCGRYDEYENAEIFNVFGHTPVDNPVINHFSANVDLGCVYKQKFKNPRLCALEFPNMRIITQENVEK